jgi:DNA-binding CsgD family transcriptional regulator
MALLGGRGKRMAMRLLERDHEMAILRALQEEASDGHGRIALISGEAGIGKTALVERFLAQTQTDQSPTARTLWAACEALFTPRPLGPLYDIAQQTTPSMRALLEGEVPRATLFTAVLDELSQAPTILVIEDIHWADEASLDLLKYLARRISRTPTLLILTYRDEELSRDHPLRLLLGDLPSRDVARLPLLPLSEAAVIGLAQLARRPARQLYAVTGGNPFFVVEALAYGAPGTPTSVSDAVLARVARRSPEAQRLLELVAVVPNRVERWVVAALGMGDEATLDECLDAHLLRLEGQNIAFRHELARQAVEGALSSARRQAFHADILHVLLRRDVGSPSLARLVHHAAQAEDAALVLWFAPEAARQAAAQKAHREAAAHYQTALLYADQLAAEQRAELLSGLANEHYLTGQIEEALAPCEAALALWRALDRTEKVGQTLCRLSRLSWLLGRNAEAERHGLAAVEALETLPPGRELAMAYGNLAQLGTRATDGAATLFWGERAITLAKQLDDYETLSYALNSVGAAEIVSGDEQGRAKLEQSLAIALEHSYEEHVARAYANLAIHSVLRHEYSQARIYLHEGIAYCAERDLDPWGHFLRWTQARVRLYQGDWAGAEEDAAAILDIPWMAVTNRIPALIVLGQVQARRGALSAQEALDESRDLALSIGEAQRIEQVAAARAEWRWLQGDSVGCAAEIRAVLREPFQIVRPWYQSELVIWLWRGAGLTAPPEGTFAPYALQIAGDWRSAAEAWEDLGCPWEQALALLEGDEAAQRASLAIFERLGATPAMEIARQRLKERGARGLARGPRPVTRRNPQGLTNRELEALLLLAEGLRNAEIADRLSTSPRTVEHHVAGVLMKLNARSRAEAVRRAYELGLLTEAPSAPGAKIR